MASSANTFQRLAFSIQAVEVASSATSGRHRYTEALLIPICFATCEAPTPEAISDLTASASTDFFLPFVSQ